MAAGNFRHGPFEAVDTDFHSFVIASNPESRTLDEALRDQIRRFGGSAEWIAVQPGYFAPVAEVIPLQFAAYHAALARGFVPGKFRYVTLVTTSETEFGASGDRS
jgi:fructoselysine-6-P-deglycase FrlB-like protein